MDNKMKMLINVATSICYSQGDIFFETK